MRCILFYICNTLFSYKKHSDISYLSFFHHNFSAVDTHNILRIHSYYIFIHLTQSCLGINFIQLIIFYINGSTSAQSPKDNCNPIYLTYLPLFHKEKIYIACDIISLLDLGALWRTSGEDSRHLTYFSGGFPGCVACRPNLHEHPCTVSVFFIRFFLLLCYFPRSVFALGYAVSRW